MAKKTEQYHNSEYWENRIANETWKTYNNAEEQNIDLIKMYDKTSNSIKKELYALAETAEEEGGLTRTQQYRFDKLLGQQGKIFKEIEKLGDSIEKTSKNRMFKAGSDVYENIMDNLGVDDFKALSKKEMEQMLRSPWHGSFFSKSLWEKMGKLENNLNGIINDGMSTGRTVTEMAVSLSNIMNRSFNDSHRLVRTETINYMNRSALRGYVDAGINKVQWWAAEDERTCEICGANHGKIYDIKKAPILPCHPGCRCTWIPVVDDDFDAENLDIPKFANKESHKTPIKRNDKEAVEQYINKMEIKSKNKRTIDLIRNDIALMPKRDLNFINNDLIIKESDDGRTFYRMAKYSKKDTIFINGDKAKPGTFAHEFAHLVAFRTNLYEDPEFVKVIENSVKGSKLMMKEFRGNKQVVVVSEKFVSYYQGRTYVPLETFKKTGMIDINDLKEYVSVGYECYIMNPQLLYDKDKMLYDFFDKRGLVNDKKR